MPSFRTFGGIDGILAPFDEGSLSFPPVPVRIKTTGDLTTTSCTLNLASATVEVLSPLVADEILVRLLLSPAGPRVAQIGHRESSVQRVAKAVSWAREHFAQPIALEDLANLTHMSVSSFHQHFKAVTTMTPLQYQKVLRLQEARHLMLSRMLDAGSAARQVGYLSASQFSREYTRLFGNAPTRDLATLRQDGARWHEDAR